MLVSAEVRKELERFIVAKLWTGPGEKNADENNRARLSYGPGALPRIVLLDPDGKVLDVLPRDDAANFVISKELLLEALRKIR